MYDVNAEDFHRPSVCMRESLRLCRAAVVAEPIRKLFPLKGVASIPEPDKGSGPALG